MKQRKKADDQEIIKFLSRHAEIRTYISLYSVAEIVATMRNEFKDKVSKLMLIDYIKTLKETMHLEELKLPQLADAGGNKTEGIILMNRLIEFSYWSYSARDSIHAHITESENLWLITRDDDVVRIKNIYPKVMGESKFRKQFEKKN